MDEAQEEAYHRAKTGHNILIVGPPGTGKTFVLSHIIENCLFEEKRVTITSTTGISACILRKQLLQRTPDLPPVTTIHRFSGIQDGRFADEELLHLMETSETHQYYKENILSLQVLIIDEISMLSLRLLQQLEYIFRHVRRCKNPFGGIQVILAGDFHQLPPIPTPDYGDSGSSVIASKLMQYFHLTCLSNIHRQSELDLITAIHDIARGHLTEESRHLLQRLQRPLPPGPIPVKLMSRREDVDLWNALHLMEMDGEEVILKSTDEGKCEGINGERELHLKIGCPVMLLVNLSDKLVNGLRGTVVRFSDSGVHVNFEDYGNTTLSQYSFTRFDKFSQKNIGIRKQIPLTLAFACTIHKSQGATLQRVDIDCRGIFQYGQLGVAVSRAQNKKGLRIQNFRQEYILKPPEEITSFLAKPQLRYEIDMSCCINTELNDASLGPPAPSHNLSLTSDDLNEDELLVMLTEEDDLIGDLSDKQVDTSLNALNLVDILDEMNFKNPETNAQIKENAVIQCLKNHCDELQNFLYVVKLNLSTKHLKSDMQLTNQDINSFYSVFHHFMSSFTYKKLVRDLFKADPSPAQYNVSYQLCVRLRKSILSELTEPTKELAAKDAASHQQKNFSQSDSGKGKIRYIGGWIISSVLKSKRAAIKRLLYSKKYVREVEKLILQKHMLESLTSIGDVLVESNHKETLHETARKQNLQRGLTDISDSCFNLYGRNIAETA